MSANQWPLASMAVNHDFLGFWGLGVVHFIVNILFLFFAQIINNQVFGSFFVLLIEHLPPHELRFRVVHHDGWMAERFDEVLDAAGPIFIESVLLVGVTSQRQPRLLAVLIGGNVAFGQVGVEGEQEKHECHGGQHNNQQYNVEHQPGNLLIDFYSHERYDDLNQCEDQHQCQRYQKDVEVLVVPFANAVAQPGAVVVKPLHAHVAVVAVRGAGRPEYVAGVAELDFLRVSFDSAGVEDRFAIADGAIEVGVADGYFLEAGVFEVAGNFGDDPRVNPGQQQHADHRDEMENG
jgi:hypothetical protein